MQAKKLKSKIRHINCLSYYCYKGGFKSLPVYKGENWQVEFGHQYRAQPLKRTLLM